MLTEELNDYVFAEIVMKSALLFRNQRLDALEKAGAITREQANKMPVAIDDVREALKATQHNKQVVFDILAELENAPAGSPAPSQDSP